MEKDQALGALEAMQHEKDASVAEVARLQHQYGETTEKHKMSEENAMKEFKELLSKTPKDQIYGEG